MALIYLLIVTADARMLVNCVSNAAFKVVTP